MGSAKLLIFLKDRELVFPGKCFKTSVDIFRRLVTLLQSCDVGEILGAITRLPKKIHAMDCS